MQKIGINKVWVSSVLNREKITFYGWIWITFE